ncbi:MAG: C40 family peptidase [Actinomycetia bacterium]|nr:C40 family peptidase [Actinomycetes bacterium]MCH9800466.1 C40 family peptidase [Actinomycetes bacterium]
MTSFWRAGRALPLALSAATAAMGLLVVPAISGPAAASDSPDELRSSLMQTDLTEIQAAREAARDKYRDAKAKAREMEAEVERNEEAATAARLTVGQYARAVYMNGPTDLSVIASMIDTDDPGASARVADEALRVGDRKDLQYDQAVALLARNQEMKVAAESAEKAAAATLESLDTQLAGLRQEMADGVAAWAKFLAGEGSLYSAEQAKLNGEAAAEWSRYLSRLANWRVPAVTGKDIKQDQLPAGVVQRANDPGIGYWSRGDKKSVLLPEQVVASVTYAVSRMGTGYKWRTNTEKEMDCAALVDRSWNIPATPKANRTDERPLPAGGVRGVAERTRLLPSSKLNVGDWVFLQNNKRGVNHVGIVVRDDLMIAADAGTGGVNAVRIPHNRVWKVGRPVLDSPRKANSVPKPDKRPFQCGADPRGFVKLPDGKVLNNPDSCPPSAIFGEGNMQPAAVRGGRCAAATWPQLASIGGWRQSDPYPDHPSGRAIDLMLPEGCSTEKKNAGLGDVIATFFMQNSGKFEVQYIIWNQRIWVAGSPVVPPNQWRGMSNRGGCTANHVDHIHVSFLGPNVNPDPAPAPEETTDEAGQDKPADKPSKSTGDSSAKPDSKDKQPAGDKPAKPSPTPLDESVVG